jgi:hypothetical protein
MSNRKKPSRPSKTKPDLKVIEGGKVEAVEIPERADFTCWYCQNPAVIWPRSKPVAVQHSIPVCTEWQKVEAKKDDLERYVIKCGVHVLVPQGEA